MGTRWEWEELVIFIQEKGTCAHIVGRFFLQRWYKLIKGRKNSNINSLHLFLLTDHLSCPLVCSQIRLYWVLLSSSRGSRGGGSGKSIVIRWYWGSLTVPVLNLDLYALSFVGFHFLLFRWTFPLLLRVFFCRQLAFFLRFFPRLPSTFCALATHVDTLSGDSRQPFYSHYWLVISKFHQPMTIFVLWAFWLLAKVTVCSEQDNMADADKVGRRVSCEGHRGTVRYFGPVAPTEGIESIFMKLFTDVPFKKVDFLDTSVFGVTSITSQEQRTPIFCGSCFFFSYLPLE